MKKISIVLLLLLSLVLVSCTKPVPEDNRKQFIVRYYDNIIDQNSTSDLIVFEDDLLEEPVDPIKDGFIFKGWFVDLEDDSTEWDFKTDKVTVNVHLHAKWETPGVTGLSMVGSVVSWDAMDNATYEISILGNEEMLTTNSYDVAKHSGDLKAKGLKITPIVASKELRSAILYITYEDGVYISAQEGDTSNLKGYYASAKGLEGKALVDELQEILSTDVNRITYGAVRYILEESDIHPTRENELSLIYNNENFNGRVPLARPIWDQGSTWEREHVWPSSKLGLGRPNNNTVNQASDPHNLRAIDGPVNAHRSNHYFANRLPSETNKLGHIVGAGLGYYPGDIDKGDTARIMMYMAVRYQGVIALTNHKQLLTGGSAYQENAAYSGKLEDYYDWHFDDAVDGFEINRNNVIFEAQNNRNPFIDHPELFKPVFDYFTKVDKARVN